MLADQQKLIFISIVRILGAICKTDQLSLVIGTDSEKESREFVLEVRFDDEVLYGYLAGTYRVDFHLVLNKKQKNDKKK